MVHWGPYLQASCHALLHHDNIGASIPSLHPFVYFSEALPVTFYNLCPLLQGHLWVRVEHLSLPPSSVKRANTSHSVPSYSRKLLCFGC